MRKKMKEQRTVVVNSRKRVNNCVKQNGRFTFERIHNTKEQIYFYERAENHMSKEWVFQSFK